MAPFDTALPYVPDCRVDDFTASLFSYAEAARLTLFGSGSPVARLGSRPSLCPGTMDHINWSVKLHSSTMLFSYWRHLAIAAQGSTNAIHLLHMLPHATTPVLRCYSFQLPCHNLLHPVRLPLWLGRRLLQERSNVMMMLMVGID